jgi:hypothetical protein
LARGVPGNGGLGVRALNTQRGRQDGGNGRPVGSGFPIEVVRHKLDDSEIFERWDHVLCVRGSRATEILDELVAAAEANNRWNKENIDRQIELEKEGRLAPYRAWQREVASSKNRVPGGVQAFGPDDPTPSWGEGGDDE